MSESKKRPLPSVAADDTTNGGTPASRNALMDSLPYVDDVREDYEEYALALIEQEMRSSKPPADLSDLPPIHFRTPLFKQEYQRMEAAVAASEDGKPAPRSLEGLSSTAEAPSDESDIEAWKSAVRQARVEYESERARSIGLEAKKDPGAALLWKGFNGSLDQELAALQQSVAKAKESVEQVNLHRSEDQQKAGKELHRLTTQYQAALERRFRLQHATAALEKEVEELSKLQ